jgi:hypothetical protein
MGLTRLVLLAAALSLRVYGHPIDDELRPTPVVRRYQDDPWVVTDPPARPTREGRPGSEPGADDCTSTMDITYSTSLNCEQAATEFVYPSTRTVYQSVDCDGCSHVEVRKHPDLHCPPVPTTATSIVPTPRLEFATVCSASRGYGRVIEGRGPQLPGIILACPTTIYVSAGGEVGPTSTVYQRTVFQTSRVVCGTCSLVVSTKIAGPGIIFKPSSTTTAAVGTSTLYQCA